MSDCPFCQLFAGGDDHREATRLYDDALIRAAHYDTGETEPTYPGYLVFGPKRHAPVADLTDDEARGLGLLAARLSRALRDVTHAEKVYIYSFGEAYDHLHFFAVARYPGAPPEYLRLRLLDWPEAPRADGERIAALCVQLRDHLRGALAASGRDDAGLAR